MRIIILLILGLLSPFLNALGRDTNPTTTNEFLKYYSGDFTDTDGDGMTDVAETHYGYDANDAEDFPTYDFFLDDGVIAGIPNDPELGSDTDQIYFRFSKFPNDLKVQTRDFLILLMPIMYDILGNPSESFVCTFYNVNRGGSWMSYNRGRSMSCSSQWIPRLLIHELVHAWKGKYGFTSNSRWGYDPSLSGFEETAEGIAYAIIHEFINAYPTHETSAELLAQGAWGNWSAKTSTYDMHKHQRFTGGGDFWIDGMSTNTRYNASAVTMQILLNHDKYFMKKVLANYYDKIEGEPDWRPNRDDLIELFANVVPEVNGIDTKDYLNALPVMRGRKLDEGVYPIILDNANARDGGSQTVYAGYADRVSGHLWLHNVKDANLAKHALPSWLKIHKATDNWYYPDHLNQPFEVNVNTIYGEKVLTYTGQTNDTRTSSGRPTGFGQVIPTELKPNNFPVGLYKETLTFTEYAKHTDTATEDYYFFGFEGFNQDKKTEVVLFIGVDSQSAKDVSIRFADGIESLEFVNGCAIFRSTELPMNIEGAININVTGNDGRVNVYRRTLINGGSNDDYRQQQFLIIDQDFDGIEDLYDSEVVPLENPSHVTYAEVVSGTYDFMVTKNTDVSTEFDIELTSTGIVINWVYSPAAVSYALVKRGPEQLFFGRSSEDHAEVNYNDYNLNGTEILTISLGVYNGDGSWSHWTDETKIDLSDYSLTAPDASAGTHDHNHDHSDEVETADVQVETAAAVVIVEDATSVEVTEDNITIVSTETNVVVVVEDTISVTEVDVTEGNVSSGQTSEINVVVVSDDSVVVSTSEGTSEIDAKDSVVVVTETEVVVDDSIDIENLVAPDLPVVTSMWESAQSIGNDWYFLDWFGYFFKVDGNDWIYNSTLGWFYVGWTTTSETVWMYHDALGWIWTSGGHFPYVYNSYDDVWMFINLEHKLYFNYTTREWKQLTSD